MTSKTDLNRLISETTIISIFESRSNNLLVGDIDNVSRYYRNQWKLEREEQCNLDILEACWKNKFNSFGKKWDSTRQLYRQLYDQFKLFYFSFKQLIENKNYSVQCSDTQNRNLSIEFATVNLCAMYLFGKKMVDLIDKLNLKNKLIESEVNFLHKFGKTRNIFFEHNVRPNEYKDIIFELDLWSIISTDSFLILHIHTSSEAQYFAKIDYYQDYYDLESIVTKIVEGFSS